MPEWTPSQRNAIDASDLDLIVSAGAGSGKTTVLTRRILERIEKGDSITDFLVVTFTKASAADLKEKLFGALSTLAAEHPGDRRLRNQLYLLPSARISTIHSFCLEVVRANFQTLGISPKVRIADEKEETMLATDVMEDLLDDCYESGDEGFSLLADTFSGTKDDAPLLTTMLSLYDRLRAFCDPFGWLNEQEAKLRTDGENTENGLFSTRLGKRLQEKLCLCFRELAEASEALSEYSAMYGGGSNMELIADGLKEQMTILEEASECSYLAFLDASARYLQYDHPRLSAKGVDEDTKDYFKDERDRIRKEAKKLCSEYNMGSEERIGMQIFATAEIVKEIGKFLTEFDTRFANAKKEKAMIGFSDAEHFLLDLLEKDGKPTGLCLSLRGQIKEIFVDEYQDVSPLQDRLFRLLSDGHNRFLVGDVKQSIYRFRNAYPDIFLDYKDDFPDYDPEKKTASARIFLRENFRSGKYILDFVNLLFDKLTTGTPYEREYKGEELVFKKKTEKDPLPVTVALSVYDGASASEAEETEAEYIASEIVRLVGTPKREAEGNYRYKDITLLFRKLKGMTEIYEKALRDRGIPYIVTKEKPFFGQPEILLALSILKAIDDPTDDISLFASMRSPAFGFTADELYSVRLCSAKGPLIRAVRTAAEGDSPLSAKCAHFLSELAFYRDLAEGRSCHAFLWELYARTGLLRLCGVNGKKNLLLLYEYARTFENGGYKGLAGLISYFKAAEEKGLDLQTGGNGTNDADAVTLTTIHRSKGLEYAAVFLCGCGKKLFTATRSAYTLLRDDGLFFRLRDYEKLTVTDTVPNRYAKMADRDAEYGEELRKLYVACTRAKEKLYVLGTVERKKYERGSFHRRAPESLCDLILYAVSEETAPCFEKIVIGEEETATSQTALPAEEIIRPGFVLTPETEQALSYTYPYRDTHIPLKVSVSELKKQGDTLASAYTPGQLLTPPAFLSAKKADPAQKGTANHVFLQFCDFRKVEQNGVNAEADRLAEKGFLTKEQYDLLDIPGLQAFFASPLYARMQSAKFLKREMRFSVRAPASLMGGSENETLLVQGVIDCIFEEQDGTLTVVDYKTDRVKDGNELLARHEVQLEQYRHAAERMTGKKVQKLSLWSFALGKEICK